ncbi:MAG: hypothetical protein HN353_09650 [Bdellovibrionales bacterium]|jgi:hypothetical protein|nr:hypothetical protein [Bdellovibrionales bacterium]MBT3525750.1 hypothetical protein [Bdellovibrionales bacterium]MBT7670137.1 hypothetical protein [Bdellovibrionales bacterium]MBT7766994.1 hypothetical protein [Bdellovibrionales bacterium]
MEQVSQEKFKLWRLALATIHVDGKVTAEEEEWFNTSISKLEINKILNFSTQQIEDLRESLHTLANKFIEEFRSIKKPSDRSILLHIIKIACYTDDEFSPEERELYRELEIACHENIDIEAVKRQTYAMEIESYHEDEVYKVNNPNSVFERVFMSILKLLNPGDYKFPT